MTDTTSNGMDPELPPFNEQEFMRQPGPVYQGLSFLWELVKVVIIALVIIVPVRYFLVQPFFVNGASMEENFHDGDYILIDEISYRFHDPVRGEIVVFRYPNDQTQFFIKRVIGLPEETVEIKNNVVTIYTKESPGGWVLKEPYLDAHQETRGTLRFKLDPDEYFVMGDNRLHSSDSRVWGAVNRSLITGRVFSRAWPLGKAEFVHTPIY
ncbi:MAG: signal peptidase I [bacterium]|nr:signal peptidase I [bacterium]